MRYKNDIKYSYPKYEYPDLTNLLITKELAYYLGLLWSDGYVTKDKAIIEIDEEDFNDIKSLIEKIGVFRYKTRKRKNREKSVTSCSIHSIKSCSWLVDNFDYREKSIKNPLKILSKIPLEYHSYFFKGYFDGDGCIYIKNHTNQLYFCGSYDQDWSHIKELFLTLNISNYKIIQKEQTQKGKINKSSVVRITSKKEILKLRNYFPNIGLKRKTNKLNEI